MARYRVEHWVRVIEYTVTVTATHPGTGEVTTRTELFRLLTTILDPAVAGAADLAGCYQQRWESETGYKAIKTCQRGPRAVLRSTDPDGVRQELYGAATSSHAGTAGVVQEVAVGGRVLRVSRSSALPSAADRGPLLARAIFPVLR